jgi:hypothetical protein
MQEEYLFSGEILLQSLILRRASNRLTRFCLCWYLSPILLFGKIGGYYSTRSKVTDLRQLSFSLKVILLDVRQYELSLSYT